MPAKVKNVVSKTKKDHTTDGQQGTDELGVLEREEKREGGREAERERERERERKGGEGTGGRERTQCK